MIVRMIGRARQRKTHRSSIVIGALAIHAAAIAKTRVRCSLLRIKRTANGFTGITASSIIERPYIVIVDLSLPCLDRASLSRFRRSA
jgi:hypothetical protein